MAEICLLVVLCYIFIRFFAGYDSRFHSGRYIVIKNPILRALLLDRKSFRERTNRLKKDINKMNVSGLSLYIVGATTMVVSLLSYLLLTKTPVDPLTAEELFVYGDTLNVKAACLCQWLFCLLVFVFMAISIIKYTKEIEQRWIKVISYVCSVAMMAVCAFAVFFMMQEFVLCLRSV